jgi:pyruvate dehydrogenase phosphatase
MRRNFVTATIAVSATALINPFIEAEKRHFSCTNCAQAQSRDESKVVAQVFASSSGQASVGTYTANDPCEDRNVFYEEAGFRIAGVFDGHGGWNVSEFASKSLIPKLLLKLKKPAVENENLDTKFDVDTISAFHEIEESYIEGVRSAYRLGHGGVASVGSCVCLAIQKGNHLTIGNCGDCRAVLGSDISGNNIETGNKQGIVSSKYVATRLSRDHNARMPLEVLNLQEQHPDEKKEDVVRCHANNPSACYVKGRLQLTRSIGDLYLKYDEFNAGAGQPRKM